MNICFECNEQIENLEEQCCERCLKKLIDEEEEIIGKLEGDMQQIDDRIKQIEQDVQKTDDLKLENEETSIKFQNAKLQEIQMALLEQNKMEIELWDQLDNCSQQLEDILSQNIQLENQLKNVQEHNFQLQQCDLIGDVFRLEIDNKDTILNGNSIKYKDQKDFDCNQINNAMGDLCIAINYLHSKHNYEKQFIDNIICDGNTTYLQKGNKKLSLCIFNQKQKVIQEFDFALDLLFQEQTNFYSKKQIDVKYPDLQWVQLQDPKWNQTISQFLENISIIIK